MRSALLSCLLSLFAVGCGGSSSETPPPLLPDPTSERYTGPRMPSAADDVALAPAAEPEEDDAADLPRKPAAATWGSGKTTVSAPKMTSPNAVPANSASPAPSASPAAEPNPKPGPKPVQPETLPGGFEF
jgi:hypothetical protein